MFIDKNIAIVYPKKYEEIAFRLAHEISKIPEHNSTTWTIEEYEANLKILSSRNLVIYIGNAEENKYTKILGPTLKKAVNMFGAVYAHDGSKAVIFGTGDLDQKSDFIKFKNGLIDAGGHPTHDHKGNIGDHLISAGEILLYSSLGGLAYKYFSKNKEVTKLKEEQTEFAASKFISCELSLWLSNNSV